MFNQKQKLMVFVKLFIMFIMYSNERVRKPRLEYSYENIIYYFYVYTKRMVN